MSVLSRVAYRTSALLSFHARQRTTRNCKKLCSAEDSMDFKAEVNYPKNLELGLTLCVEDIQGDTGGLRPGLGCLRDLVFSVVLPGQ